jgi:hypothetical protein
VVGGQATAGTQTGSVLIDFVNTTNNPVFSSVVEQLSVDIRRIVHSCFRIATRCA